MTKVVAEDSAVAIWKRAIEPARGNLSPPQQTLITEIVPSYPFNHRRVQEQTIASHQK